jgi:hypothetical protein
MLQDALYHLWTVIRLQDICGRYVERREEWRKKGKRMNKWRKKEKKEEKSMME